MTVNMYLTVAMVIVEKTAVVAHIMVASTPKYLDLAYLKGSVHRLWI